MTVLVKKCVAVSGVNFRVRPMPISRVEVKTCRQGDTLLHKMEKKSLTEGPHFRPPALKDCG